MEQVGTDESNSKRYGHYLSSLLKKKVWHERNKIFDQTILDKHKLPVLESKCIYLRKIPSFWAWKLIYEDVQLDWCFLVFWRCWIRCSEKFESPYHSTAYTKASFLYSIVSGRKINVLNRHLWKPFSLYRLGKIRLAYTFGFKTTTWLTKTN